MSAPHVLPLQPGQTVAMRAWWRHWALDHPAGSGSGQGDTASDNWQAAVQPQHHQQASTGTPQAPGGAAAAAAAALSGLGLGLQGANGPRSAAGAQHAAQSTRQHAAADAAAQQAQQLAVWQDRIVGDWHVSLQV